MLRWIKYGIGTLVVVGGLGFFALGPNCVSYLTTTANSAREMVRESVPVEFELKRARQLIDDILPDLQSQIRMIAHEEVEIAALKKEIDSSENQQASEETAIAGLRQKMNVYQVSYKVNGRDIDRDAMTETLAQRFRRFKQGEFTLKSKQRLLEKREAGLNAALAMLEKMKHRKGELELKVEALAAQHRMVQASAIESGSVIDESQLASADQLLDSIENRLKVAERVLEYEQDLSPDTIIEDAIDEAALMAEMNEYFGE